MALLGGQVLTVWQSGKTDNCENGGMVDATLDGVMYIAQSYISWSEGLVKNREYVVQVQVLLLAQVVREDEDILKNKNGTSEIDGGLGYGGMVDAA